MKFTKGHHWRTPKPHWDRAWLDREYSQNGRAASDIAAQSGCNENNILFWLSKHGIPRRSMKEVRQRKHWGVSGKNNPMFGRTGAANPRFVDGGSPERQRLYVQGVGREFLKAVRVRDEFKCVRCRAPKKGPKSLHVHHIRPWAGHPEMRFDMGNVVTLCRDCHSWVHSKANAKREWLA